MREIKFRQPIYINGKFTKWHYWGFTERDHSFIGPATGDGRMDNFQFTGLTDSEGVEIYDGDIVEFRDGKIIEHRFLHRNDGRSM